MIFSKEQIEEIEKAASKNDAVKLLWEEYQQFLIDPAKLYYTALTEAIVELSIQIKSKTIDVEDPYTKSILRLSETGDKVFNTLERGKQELHKGLEDLSSIIKETKADRTLKLHSKKALI